MKKLFKVYDPSHPGKGQHAYFFESKKLAKEYRNTIPGAVVHRGPDHYKGETF